MENPKRILVFWTVSSWCSKLDVLGACKFIHQNVERFDAFTLLIILILLYKLQLLFNIFLLFNAFLMVQPNKNGSVYIILLVYVWK